MASRKAPPVLFPIALGLVLAGPAARSAERFPLGEGLGSTTRFVTTKSPEAQR